MNVQDKAKLQAYIIDLLDARYSIQGLDKTSLALQMATAAEVVLDTVIDYAQAHHGK